MRKLSLTLSAVLAVALLFMSGVQFATSAPNRASGVHSSHNAGIDAVGHGAPFETYFTTGDAQLILSGATPLGSPVQVTCPATTSSCTVEIDNVIQMGGGGTANNRWAVWETQGEHRSVPGGQWMGVIPTHGWVTGSDIEVVKGVPPGRHAIQPVVYAQRGGKVFLYMIVIRVYAP
jgi:hypothetical protein